MEQTKNKPSAGESTVYDKLALMVEETFQVTQQMEEELNVYEGFEYYKMVLKEIIAANKGVIAVTIGFIAVAVHLLVGVRQIMQFYLILNPQVFTEGMGICLLCVIIPFLIWVWSTKYGQYVFWNRKMRLLLLCIIHAAVQILIILSYVVAGLLFPIFARIPTGPDITISMVCNLMRIISAVVTFVPVIFLIKMVIKEMYNPLTKREICNFKISKYFDGRKGKKYLYDMKIVRNLETGQPYVIEEKDRYLHSLSNGVTGTGKTSMLITTAVNADFEQIVFNKDSQKKDCEKMLKAGEIRLKHALKDADFNIDDFEGLTQKAEKTLQKIKFQKKVAGVTVLAPDAAFADEIYGLAHAKGLKTNRIDPILGPDGYLKHDFMGFNPLYITDGLNEIEFVIEAGRKAILCADVLQAIYDAEGSSDIYFASLNKNLTTTISLLLIFTFPKIHRRQPILTDVQQIINNFSSAQDYRDELVNMYGKRNSKGRIVFEGGHPVMSTAIFQTIVDTVDTQLLGVNREAMEAQITGLRIIINTLLMDLNVANVLCSRNTIDMDKMLERGEITIFNFALELGPSGKGMGLFFILSYINAAFRRPGDEDTRIPNFFYCDEFPQVLHPKEEQCFVLFRKYRIAIFAAIQSLSQMQKQPSMRFMQSVLLGNCAHHFVFGRAGTEEMKLYQELAGKSLQLTEMAQVNETSLMSDNPTISYGTREQTSMENSLEGAMIHNRDFQEVTVFTVRRGSPVGIFFGKLDFLPKYKKKINKKRYSVDWSVYNPESNKKEEEITDMKESVIKVVQVTATDQFGQQHKSPKQEQEQVPAFMQQLNKAKADMMKESEKSNESRQAVQEHEEKEPDEEKDNSFSFMV